MIFNVAQLLKAPIGTTRQYDVADRLPPSEENAITEPVSGHVKLVRTLRGVLVEADLATAARLECGRCLEETTTSLSLHIEEEFIPTIDVNTGFVVPPQSGDDESDFRIDDHHQLDISEAVRQYGLLEIPLQPLCRENCAGLCPTCGANLNDGVCGCQIELADPRLLSLQQLFGAAEGLDGRQHVRQHSKQPGEKPVNAQGRQLANHRAKKPSRRRHPIP